MNISGPKSLSLTFILYYTLWLLEHIVVFLRVTLSVGSCVFLTHQCCLHTTWFCPSDE